MTYSFEHLPVLDHAGSTRNFEQLQATLDELKEKPDETAPTSKAPIEHGRSAKLKGGEEHSIAAPATDAAGTILVTGELTSAELKTRTPGTGFKVLLGAAEGYVNWAVWR
jgi:hypothetical protein